MVEIRKTADIATDSQLSMLIDRQATLISELSPQNATAVWKRDAELDDASQVRLHISDAYGRSSQLLSVVDLSDGDRMLARISRLVGDLVYQQCENLSDPGTLAHLASFTPGRLCLRFTEQDPHIPLPSGDDVPCALLFADISGFTRLTERLAAKGPVGAEELTLALNRYFGDLIEIVGEYGGDVLKFAGDALVAVFEDRIPGAALRDAAARATSASLIIQRKMQNFPEVEGTKLSLKTVLVAGDLRIMHLGGVFGRCEVLIVGDPLKEVGTADKVAEPGDIIASSVFFRRVEGLVESTPVDDGHYRIHGLRQRDEEDFETSSNSGQQELVDAPFRVSSVAAMRGYIPAAIYARLAAGQTDWLGELRKVSVLFANLPGFSRETPIEDAQRLMVTLQRTVYQFEGSLNKMSVDDKGVSMLAGFGLPPVAHEDDAVRAISCAQALHERITQLGWKCSIGVASGRIFCGAYGNDQRREYTMIGDTVNTSARLMQAADGHILCGQATWREAESRFDFEILEPVRMKGKSEPVPIYRPLGRRMQTAYQARDRITVIGRKDEVQLFDEQLKTFVETRASCIVYVEGEAGVGKSHLVDYFEQSAEDAGCRVLYDGGDAIERSTPWYGWRSIVTGVLGVEDQRLEPEWLKRALRDRFELSEETMRLAPLLSSVLPVVWSDNDWTAQMSGAIRATNVNELLSELISQAARQEPLVISLEDVHWFDSASLALLNKLASQFEPVMILAATRPMTQPIPREIESLLRMPVTHHFQLDDLPADEAVQMARHLLEVSSLPEAVENLVSVRSHGNPLFVKELTLTLRDSGTLKISDGTARVVGDLQEFRDRQAAGSLASVIVNRIDTLTPSEQLVVKVASAIGYEFSYAILRDIFPVEQERTGIRDCLQSLCDKQVIQPLEDRVELEYVYRHRALRDVAYNLVLQKHRIELHTAIGEWIEAEHSDELEAHYPLLAEHWLLAGDLTRAVRLLAQAGHVALQNSANREAARFYRKALNLEPELDQRIDTLERARWERRYGEALYCHGEIVPALNHLRKALKLLGHPDPESLIGASVSSGTELTRQLFRRWRTALFGKPAGRPTETLIESVRAYERLFEIHYMRNDLVGNTLAAFRSLNLAERYGFCPELSRSYASASVIISSMMLYGAADRYVDRGKRIAGKTGDLPSMAYVKAIGSIHYIATGNWETAQQILGEAIPLCTEIGDRRRWSEASALIMNLNAWVGDWDSLLDHSAKLHRVAEADNVSQLIFWAIGWMTWVASARDPHDETLRKAETDLESWIRNGEEMPLADEVLVRGGLLLPRLRRGEWESAVAVVNEIETVLGYAQPVAIYLLPAYCAMADLYYALAKSGYESALIKQKEIRRRLRLMHFRIQVFSVLIPISVPLRNLSAARRLILKGRTNKASRILKKGIARAESLRIPYFIAMLKIELAGIAETDEQRDANLSEAHTLLRQLKVTSPEVLSLRPSGVRA